MNKAIKESLIDRINKMKVTGKSLDEFIQEVRDALAEISDHKAHPVDAVKWVPLDMVQANDYNPNTVAAKEMDLLYTSISHDGYTQPIVTVWDELNKKFIIVDGFHRYFVCKTFADIKESTRGMVPIVVIKKGINDRMASTVRHNRARGRHVVQGMSNMVLTMVKNGMKDSEICNELGLEPEELIKLKHVTGIAKLFKDHKISDSWESQEQIRLRMKYEKENVIKT